MRLTSRPKPEQPPEDPNAWRPQEHGRRNARGIDDPIVEPGWTGVHVIAHVSGAGVVLRDEEAIDCTAEFTALAGAIAEAALAGELILDGYLTVQATQPSEGRSATAIAPPTQGDMLRQLLVGDRVGDTRGGPEREAAKALDPDRPIAFVAVDLLSVDGARLLDVPLAERKRLLETVLREGDLVRVSPYVRPPLGTFLTTWQTLGFGSVFYKGANSRYVPGGRSDAWAVAAIPRR